MRLKKNQVVCELCRKIFLSKDSKEFVAGYEFGSCNSATPDYGVCCPKCYKKKVDDETGEVKGRVYA